MHVRKASFVGLMLVLAASPLMMGQGCITLPWVDLRPNTAPRADAGAPQQVMVGQTVHLNGLNSSDPDGDTLTYLWTQSQGPQTVALVNANSGVAAFVAPTEGTYIFTLTVNDGRASDQDTVKVEVVSQLPTNQARLDVEVVGQGAVEPASGVYTLNSTITLKAAAFDGWRFDRWEGDLSETSTQVQVFLDRSKSVRAVFVRVDEVNYTLTVTVQGQGTVHPTGGVYASGTSVELAATPASGWVFDRWEGDLTGTVNPATLVMNADCQLTAVFVRCWVKYSGNPVLDLGATGAWDDTRVNPGSVILEDGVYRMWYTGWDGTPNVNFQIGHATSPDGINWTRDQMNPVLVPGSSGAWDSLSVAEGSVIKDGDTYKMWYSGTDGTIRGIGYATSSDGINWNKHASNPILQQGAVGDWDSWGAFFGPAVIKDGSVYKMWYSGGMSFLTSHRIGYATSSDGVYWEKYSGNPVLAPQCSASWDDQQLWFPEVIKDGTTYHMWVGCYDGSINRIGYASSNDGISWQFDCDSPALDVGGAGDWDQSILVTSVLKTGDGWMMWYQGYQGPYGTPNGEIGRIGYASCQGSLGE